MTATMEAAARGTIDFQRGSDWFDPRKNPYAKVQVFGAGGIGSWVCLGLAKLGVPYVDVIDFDVVEAHNVPNQMFPLDSVLVGEHKASALTVQMGQYGVGIYTPYDFKVTHEGLVNLNDESDPKCRITGPVVVSGFDNMTARADLWSLVKGNLGVRRYIDGRLAGDKVVIYSVDPHDLADVSGYEATLHSDEEGEVAACTRQSIIDIGMLVGSLITRQVRTHFAEQDMPSVLYVSPDLTVYKSGWLDG